MDLVNAYGLQGRDGPIRLHRGRGAARHRRRCRPFWPGSTPSCATSAPRNRALLARRDELQAKIDAWHANAAASPRPGGLRSVPHRDRLPAARSARRLRRSTPPDVDPRDRRASPGRSWWCRSQRPLRAERRQRPLGQPLRRALRHRRPRPRTTAPSGTATTRRAARGGRCACRAFLDRDAPLAAAATPTPSRYAVEDGELDVVLAAPSTGAGGAAASCAG